MSNEAIKAKLTEYDSIVLIDRSGSMAGPAKGYTDRWTQAKEITIGIATLAAQVDEDGITVITFGGSFNPSSDVRDGLKDASAVAALFGERGPNGGTPTAEALEAAFAKKFAAGKKAVIVVVTDGEPNDKSGVEKAIVAATQKLTTADEIKILFIQVGDDSATSAWLSSLDNSLSGAKFDIVNAIAFKDADGLSAEDLLARALDDTH